ncbi:BREX-2 system adenine-specific DNA-methyltransferase PglX [Nocardia cerradoensis]|uniref:site-specific DNA-methyltransferase (adenine-specific) n=1 Tax=Nocardia cerradoensis TaxID=85688 RepID=A0A231H584_9NOCA|nr:BREX-2 system adenine-specific DNA-methyltransferase PglX [Nocardia cerradoensis]NKY44287.1 BREX-2 system adenine-specific DNA-methyltransferase PglX [Nocardia cerradoensis]OXR44000.1 Modification methylase PaeR7I [Nocardia cerradoensis]
MIDRAALLSDLKKQVSAAETDLHQQLRVLDEVKSRLHDEYSTAFKLKRTAATESAWLKERVTQVAVAWILGTVFVRFCEDNELIAEPYLTGPTDDRRELAQARYEAYVESDPDPTYRGWLHRAFAELGAGQAGKLLFDPAHNGLYQIPLSHDGARELIEFWRERDESGVLIHDFTDPLDDEGINGWDTRFLGDLYQDLSEDIRKNYALLQTPEFVEEFILDRTLTPAIGEFGYEGIKLIDPTCGSGHFVLGAFKRLTKLWAEGKPAKDRHERVRAALDSVHGVDINPFAIAIARFRLLVAAMAAARIRNLATAAGYEWPINLAVGDSLIKARQLELALDGEHADPLAEFSYATEDVQDYPGILKPGTYHVVVGNPPYITVKDKNLNAIYRELYDACAGAYALSVPFAQRFFELAKLGNSTGDGFGRVGQITANSFLKREFGIKLIEEFFANKVELTEIIDTSGAYIPGHGTPTVILIGTRRSGNNRATHVRTVRSVQGEPKSPISPADGLVWRSIIDQIDSISSKSQWVTVDDLDRQSHFGKHPWVLADSGLEMIDQLANSSVTTLGQIGADIGTGAVTREDNAYMLGEGALRRKGISPDHQKPLVEGSEVRDFAIQNPIQSLWPYNPDTLKAESSRRDIETLWPYRTLLRIRSAFGKTQIERSLKWFEYSMFFSNRYRIPLSIAFPFVATHNHFVLDRGEKVFIRTAPVIKLPEAASEEEHLRLLGLLNSSTACFWLKMVSHDKGSQSGTGGFMHDEWERFFEFTGTNLADFPIPAGAPSSLAKKLDELATQLTSLDLITQTEATPTAAKLVDLRDRFESLRRRMIALQEELDWKTYNLYNLLDEEVCADEADVPEISLGERAFEIVLARLVGAGEVSTVWFDRHDSTPITEIPTHWPEGYRRTVQRRIEIIESSRAIGMIERPQYKRRWATEGWDSLQHKALRSWLLSRMESRGLWSDDNGQPRILTLPRLTDVLATDDDFVSVAALHSPRTDLAQVVADLITDQHVPFISALRYKPSGLKKRQDWEHVWDMQRQEDTMPDGHEKNEFSKSIPVPPKYTNADFLRTSFWQARGKLDVPKERFISYGATNVVTPDLYGWAGWDHREQAMAIAIHLAEHSLSTEEITPFLAGLLELQPWLDQWHNDIDPDFGISPAEFLSGDRRERQAEHGLTDDDLRNWRPQPVRGRRAAAKDAPKTVGAG